MKTLILHNNNLPQDLIINSDDTKCEVVSKPNSYKSLDLFIHGRLEEIFSDKNKQYDVIVLPFTLIAENYIEFDGVRVAAHIRLTKGWRHTRVPIVFIGPDTPDIVARYSDLGMLLFTPGVFYTDVRDKKSLENFIADKISPLSSESQISESEYNEFLSRIKVNSPASYATHHSIANEWAIIRWIEMLKWDNCKNKPSLDKQDFLSMLFFKYLLVKSGRKENVKKALKENPLPPVIDDIKDKRILLIDDEFDKGWKDLLSAIFSNSGAKLYIYEEFKNKSKTQLINDINRFVSNHDAECYLIDLRLHEDDYNCSWKELSGHIISKHILEQNKANQIVVFTASNKVWNMRRAKEVIGASGYVIKETPELNFTIKESQEGFGEFKNAILSAVEQSYIKEYVKLIESAKEKQIPYVSILDDYIDLLLKNDKELVKQCILCLTVFLENFLNEYFNIRDCKYLHRKGDSKEIQFDKDNVFILKKAKIERIFFKKPSDYTKEKYEKLDIKKFTNENNPNYRLLITRCAALYLYYGKGKNDTICDEYMLLRNERNGVAHKIDESSFNYTTLAHAFDVVIKRILKTEIESKMKK